MGFLTACGLAALVPALCVAGCRSIRVAFLVVACIVALPA